MENLRKLREEFGLTQKELAEKMNVAKATIYFYEQNKVSPSTEMLIKLADYFNCSIDYLLGHQTKNLIYTETLTPIQQKLMELIKKLNDEQGLFLIGYLSDMLKIPYDQVKPVSPY